MDNPLRGGVFISGISWGWGEGNKGGGVVREVDG